MEKLKKIAIVTPSLNIGGAEKVLVDLATTLNNNEFKVKIFALDKPKENQFTQILKDNNIEFIFIRCVGNFIKNYRAFSKQIKEFGPSLVHTHMDFTYGTLWARLNSVPFVYTIHSQPYRIFCNKKYKYFLKSVLSKRDIITAVSPIINKELVDILSLKSKQVVTIFNPVTVENPVIRNKKGEEIIFTNVARFHKVKNHPLLLKSFALLLKDFPNARLKLAGDGENRNQLENLANDLGITQNVDFLGNVSNVPELLKKSDVFVLSSDTEAMPISVLEAMAQSLPIVSTNVGGVPDIVTNNGMLVKKGSDIELSKAMLTLALDSDLRRKYGANSYDNVQKFKAQNIALEYEKLYKSMVRG